MSFANMAYNLQMLEQLFIIIILIILNYQHIGDLRCLELRFLCSPYGRRHFCPLLFYNVLIMETFRVRYRHWAIFHQQVLLLCPKISELMCFGTFCFFSQFGSKPGWSWAPWARPGHLDFSRCCPIWLFISWKGLKTYLKAWLCVELWQVPRLGKFELYAPIPLTSGCSNIQGNS